MGTSSPSPCALAIRLRHRPPTHANWIVTFPQQGYSEFRLSRFPSATAIINDYAQGSDPANSLGTYWERPGRTILDEHLVAVPDPREVLPDKFSEFERVFFTGAFRLR